MPGALETRHRAFFWFQIRSLPVHSRLLTNRPASNALADRINEIMAEPPKQKAFGNAGRQRAIVILGGASSRMPQASAAERRSA
jgi:hypothetical protein